MVDTAQAAAGTRRSDTGPAATTESKPKRRRPRRRIVKRSFVWLHRWLSLVLGALLLVVTTSGAVLVYQPDIVHWEHRSAYVPDRPSGSTAAQGGMRLSEIPAVLRDYDPAFVPAITYDAHGTYAAESYEPSRKVTIDPRTRAVIGDFDPASQAGALDWTLGLLANIHECGLACEGQPGYQAWLTAEVPFSEWAGFEGAKINWAGLLLGVSALLLLFLALSGIWLWWPGVRHWYRGVRLRLRKGRYARDYDLHQVVGMITIPLLLAWAVTGAGYEFGFVAKAWYAVTPGSESETSFTSKPATGKPVPPDISPDAAVAAAQRFAGTASPPVSLDLPSADEDTASYVVWFADGLDPYAHWDYSGDYGVGVDRRTGETGVAAGGPGRPIGEELWNDWNFPVHTGYVVGPWWRLLWFLAGLAPLLLAVTGVSTWLWKRGVTRRRRQLQRSANPTVIMPAGRT